MARSVTQYDLLMSCPGDIKDELEIITKEVEKFNELYSEVLGISIRLRHWSKSSYPESGGKPQELLNKQFVDDCDAAIALMWSRFGTPTDEYDSGTEEEIERMLSNGKQVFMYFSNKPISLSEIDSAQFERVKKFKEKYSNVGIYYEYSSLEQFSQLLFAHLSSYFLSHKQIEEIKNERQSKLTLKGVKNNLLSEYVFVEHFKSQKEKNEETCIEHIKEICDMISSISINKNLTNPVNLFGLNEPVKINENQKEIIDLAIEKFGITIAADFYDLGHLTKNAYSDGFGNSKFSGTKEEKDKYNLFVKLINTIDEFISISPIEEAFKNLKCIKLVLANEGTQIDEDVEIIMEFPKNSILWINEFEHFSNDTMGYFMNKYGMSEFFGIESTAEFMNYENSIKETINPKYIKNSAFTLPGYIPNYETDYYDELEDVFCYDKYVMDNSIILKLKVDYIKHYTAIAFPTIIFLKTDIEEIKYKISSKNNSEMVEEKIKVINNELI